MKLKTIALPLATIGLVGAMATSSFASGYRHVERQRNEWNGLAIGSAALGIFGLATHQDGLAIAGALGTGYSLYRAGNVSDRWGRRDYDDYRVSYRRDYRDRDRDRYDFRRDRDSYRSWRR